MNLIKRLASVFLIISSLTFSLSAKTDDISTLKGVNLSNEVYNFLKAEKYTPLTQTLVTNGNNIFPYNVYLKFNSQKITDKNLLLIIHQEQMIENKNVVLEILSFIKNLECDSNISVLFSYGDKQIIQKQVMIYGSEVFINTLNSNEENTAIILDLNNENNKIITSCNGQSSPSWLIQNEFNLYLKENLYSNLPFYYVSQIYKMKFFEDKELETLFQHEIPGIKLCFNKANCENGKAANIIKDSISNYLNIQNNNWEHHFLLFRLFDRYINIDEAAIIRIIIFIIFLLLLFVFLLGFANIRIKNRPNFKLGKVWYSVPLTLILSYISFICGRGLFNPFANKVTTLGSIYFCLTLQISIALLLVTLFYILILMMNYNITEKTIDFLVLISCFINQSLFILFDISLFPLFLVIFILAVVAYYIKNNGIHICIFLLMILALVPYCNTLVTKGNPATIQQYVLRNSITPITISLVLYPIFMMHLRILTSYKNKFSKTRSFIIFTICSFVFISSALIIFSAIRTKRINNTFAKTQEYKISEITDNKISVKYTDKAIFTDIIRTIDIDLEGTPEVCDVRINSATSTPVLYSDNDYEAITQNSVIFKIPEYPSEHLTFSYGANKEPCVIVISAIYMENDFNNLYTLVTKAVSIGDL